MIEIYDMMVWYATIPPSKSFLIWRLLRWMPTDEQTLKQRLCQCAVSVKMIMKPCLSFSFNVGWQRIFGVNFVIFWSSILIILRQAIFFKVFDQGWSPYFKDLILVAITNIIWTIWHDRITIKFKYKKSQLLKLINWSSKKKKN